MELVTKKEFSRRCGVNASSVTKALKRKLAAALVGDQIDVHHDAAKGFYERNAVRRIQLGEANAPLCQTPVNDAPTQHIRSINESDMQVLTSPTDNELGKFGDMKLKDIVRKFGTMHQFLDHLKSTKEIENIRALRIKNAQMSGNLISREHVQTFVIGAIETSNVRLLNDAPRTICARVIAAHKAGETPAGCEEIARKVLSSQIRSLKQQATKGLASA